MARGREAEQAVVGRALETRLAEAQRAVGQLNGWAARLGADNARATLGSWGSSTPAPPPPPVAPAPAAAAPATGYGIAAGRSSGYYGSAAAALPGGAGGGAGFPPLRDAARWQPPPGGCGPYGGAAYDAGSPKRCSHSDVPCIFY